jgi:hypothetical protein
MYAGVPSVTPISVSVAPAAASRDAAHATPKSASSACPSARRTLPGFRSRWMTPRACA